VNIRTINSRTMTTVMITDTELSVIAALAEIGLIRSSMMG